MQLNYSLNKLDILFARILMVFQNKTLLGFAFLVVCFFTLSLSTAAEVDAVTRVVVAVISFVFTAILYFAIVIALTAITTYLNKFSGVIGTHALEIKEEGLEESTAVNRSFYRWNASFRIKEFGNYVWIYPTDSVFFLVSKKQGAYEGDFAAFMDQLKTKIRSYKPMS